MMEEWDSEDGVGYVGENESGPKSDPSTEFISKTEV